MPRRLTEDQRRRSHSRCRQHARRSDYLVHLCAEVRQRKDVPATVTVRSFGQWNLGLAVLADASDLRGLVALSHYLVAINALADVPANDAVGAPHAPILVLTALFGALGLGTSRGVVPSWPAAASAIGNGLHFYLFPKAAWAAYSADGKGVSQVAVSWTRGVG